MKVFVSTCFILFIAGSVLATIPNEPDFTFRWSGYNSVTVKENFAFGTTDNGLVLLKQLPQQLGYEQVNYLFLPIAPREQKIYDSILVIRNVAGQLYVVDLRHLPQLTVLGTLDIEVPYNDFIFTDSTLYVSHGFDGLWRYRIRDFDNPIYLDSSIVGIDYTQLAISHDTLYALDQYNGILIYRLQGADFASFLDYLYIPFEAKAFALADSALIVSLSDSRVLLARAGPGTPSITDTIPLLVLPTKIFTLGNVFIAVDTTLSYLEAVDLSDDKHTWARTDDNPVGGVEGTITVFDSTSYILYPSRSGSLIMYGVDALLSNLAVPLAVSGRYGPVTGLGLQRHRLFIGGESSPLDVYDVGADGHPTFHQTLYSGLDRITGIDQTGDSLLVLYPQLKRALTLQVAAESTIYRGSLFLDTMRYNSIHLNPGKFDTVRTFFGIGPNLLGVYTINDSGITTAVGTIQSLGTIFGAELVDSIIAIATSKGIWFYRLFNDLTFEYRSTWQPFEGARQILAYHGKLIVFDGNRLRVLDISDPVNPLEDTVVGIPSEVYATCVNNGYLYAVGRTSIMVFQLSESVPHLIDHGGRAGQIITAENGIVAVSDANSIQVYDLRNIATSVADPIVDKPEAYQLTQNYPNPFNPSTTISFTLPQRTNVALKIYNLLGQDIVTLIDEYLSAGSHFVVWNGNDRSGTPVASGVYLYHITAGSWSASQKMILLR